MQRFFRANTPNSMLKVLPAALLTIALIGCATGPQYQPVPAAPAGKAILVIYREPTFASAAWPQSFWIDGKQVAELRVKAYTFIAVPPGERRVHFGGPHSESVTGVTVTLKARERVYIRYGTSTGPVVFAGQTPIASNSGQLRVTSVETVPPEITEYVFQAPTIASLD
jgi:hypothetical protein